MKRGDIRLVALDAIVGSEIGTLRPCVIVSTTELNEHLRAVIVAPMISKGFAAPFRVPVTHAAIKMCTVTVPHSSADQYAGLLPTRPSRLFVSLIERREQIRRSRVLALN